MRWKEFFHYSVPSLAALGMSFFINISIAKIIGPSQFGQYNLIISYGQIWLIIASLGLSTAVVKYTAEVHRRKLLVKKIATTALLLTVLASTVGFLILILIPQNIIVDFGLNPLLWKWALAWGIIMAIKLLISAFIKGRQRLVEHGWLDFISVFLWGVSIVLLIKQPRLELAYFLVLVYNLVFIFIGITLIKNVWGKPNLKIIKKLLAFSVWVILGNILSFFSGYFDRLVVNRFLGTTELGVYSAYATFSLQVAGYLSVIAVGYLFPKVSAMKNKVLLLAWINSRLWLIVPASVIIFTIGAKVGFVILGSSYPFSWFYSFWFALAASIAIIWHVRVPIMQSLGVSAMRFGTLTSIINTSAGVVAMLVLTPRLGFLGLIFGQIIISIGAIIFQNYFFSRYWISHKNDKMV